ncbi:MAG: hypothetical protein ABI388_11020 [Bacteroidia bacterium]
MNTDRRFDAGNVQLDSTRNYCNHPMLHPTLTKSGFHTGFYVCVKCHKIIKDNGTTMIKVLFF